MLIMPTELSIPLPLTLPLPTSYRHSTVGLGQLWGCPSWFAHLGHRRRVLWVEFGCILGLVHSRGLLQRKTTGNEVVTCFHHCKGCVPTNIVLAIFGHEAETTTTAALDHSTTGLDRRLNGDRDWKESPIRHKDEVALVACGYMCKIKLAKDSKDSARDGGLI
jgi:hypothetical protein